MLLSVESVLLKNIYTVDRDGMKYILISSSVSNFLCIVCYMSRSQVFPQSRKISCDLKYRSSLYHVNFYEPK